MKKFKKHIIKIALLVGLIIPTFTNAQIRTEINQFTSAQRTMLVNAMMEYIDADVIEYHCTHPVTAGGGIHSDWDFLPFHRVYVQGMEDYLLSKGAGYEIFVPLPYYDPELGAVPTEFQVIDPNCGDAVCAGDIAGNPNSGSHPVASCEYALDWNPGTTLNSYFQLPSSSTTGLGDDICDWELNCIGNPTPNQVGIQGIDDRIESPWHNQGHIDLGGIMLNFRSPAAPIFWLWHAYVDDIWKKWECNCTSNTTNNTLPFDMYMKDNSMVTQSERDRGEEPNIDQEGPMWESEDIWIRRQQDGLTNHEHQNAEYYSVSTNFNYIYVQVRNRGCVPTSGTNQLKVYWAKAGTALSYPNHWNGSLNTSNGQPVGDILTTITLPVIQPGSSYIAEIPWQPVDPANYVNLDNSTDPLFWISSPEPHHFCLLARIESSADPITFTNGNEIGEYVRQNNNVVWKNLSVVDLDPNNIAEPGGWEDDRVFGGTVLVGDVLGNGGTYDLEFTNPDFYKGNPVTAEAEIKVTLSPHVWDKWQTGGFQSENIVIDKEVRHQIIATGSPAKIKNLTFGANEQNLVHVGFNFLAEKLTGQEKFKYRVIQRDHTTNQIIGGETYEIKVPGRPGFYANAGGDKEISEGESTNLNAYDIGEAAIYNWYDQDGNLIYTGKDFTASPEITEKYKLEVIAELDGVKDYDEVEVKVKEFEILSMSPSPATNQLNFEYNANNASSAYMIIMMPYGNSYNHILDVTQNQKSINVSAYQTGAYNVILVCNGQAVDASTLVVQ